MSLLPNVESVHFVGIGGIGMSGLARLFLASGASVTGSDVEGTVITDDLQGAGVGIVLGEHIAENISDDVDLVVRTVAAEPGENVEVDEALRQGIKVFTYPEALGEVTKQKKTIAVTGTHGKTTTSAMISKILLDEEIDPTVLVGSRLPFLDGANARLGKSDWLVIEADEYRRAFHHYWADVIVVTNVEFDHPDAFEDEAAMQKAYAEFLEHLKPGGLLVLNVDDGGTVAITKEVPEEASTLFTSVESDDRAALVPDELVLGSEETSFRVGKTAFSLGVPGKHNVANALQAIAVADHLEVDRMCTSVSLAGFTGTWRRFEVKGERDGAVIIDDYAHHPTEVRATLAAAKQRYPDKKIVCVFQAHHRARLQGLLDDFSGSFGDADEIVLLPTYHVEGREEGLPDETSTLLELLRRKDFSVVFVETFEQARDAVLPMLDSETVVLTLGAGDITDVPGLILDA